MRCADFHHREEDFSVLLRVKYMYVLWTTLTVAIH
jgi:hypothetical protein